jgi:hypothetical protein
MGLIKNAVGSYLGFNDGSQAGGGDFMSNIASMFGNTAPQGGTITNAPVTPPQQMGPTVAANQGQQPTNPINGMGAVPGQGPIAPVVPQPQMQQAPQPQMQQAPQGQQYPMQMPPGGLPAPQAQGPVAPVAPQPQPQQSPQPQPQQAPAAPVLAPTAPNQPVQPAAQGAQPTQIPPSTPAAPAVPIAGPTANPTYNAMLHVESGNQDYKPDGSPMLSKTGALFAGQVMPATANQPGYGIKPAASVTPEEYNRVGREYWDAMQKRFPGEKEKAIAAYNAGEGNVHKAMDKAAQRGGDWRQYLPKETQGYLSKVSLAEGNQGASHFVNSNVNGIAQNQHPLAATELPNAGVAPKPLENPADQAYWDKFHAAQNDPSAMAQLSYDATAPAAIRQAASTQHLQQLQSQKAQGDAQDQVNKALATGDTSDFARMLKAKTEEGSYVKAYLFHKMGLEDLSKNEQQKLGAGNTWQASIGPGGERATINYDGNNKAIEGYDASGRRLTGNELGQYAAQAIPLNKASTGAEVYYDPTGRSTDKRFSYVQTPAGGRFVEAGTGKLATPSEQASLVKMSATGPLEQQYQAAYLRGGGTAQGTQAAQGFQNAPLPAAPSAPGVGGAPATAPQATPQPQGQPPIPTGAQPQGGGPVAPTGAVPHGAVAPQVAPQTRPMMAPGQVSPVQPIPAPYMQKMQAEQQMAVGTEEQKQYVKDKQNIVDDASNGQKASQNRQQALGTLLDNPSIMGYLADPTTSGQFWKLARDVASGAYAGEHGAELSNDATKAGLPAPLRDAINLLNNQNAFYNSTTLHSNEGVGKISNFEIQNNIKNNLGNFGEAGPAAILTTVGNQKWSSDLAVAKQQFTQQFDASGQVKTPANFQSAWSRESDNAFKQYQAVVKAREIVLQPSQKLANMPANKDNAQIQQQYRQACIAAYRTYPVPRYNPSANKWQYDTKEAKMAAMQAIGGGQ